MRFHYLHRCGLTILNVPHKMHRTEIATANFLQQLISVHRHIIYDSSTGQPNTSYKITAHRYFKR